MRGEDFEPVPDFDPMATLRHHATHNRAIMYNWRLWALNWNRAMRRSREQAKWN